MFVLKNVLVMGFPPIPLAARPVLVASEAQVNAVVDLIHGRHVHFIVSGMAHGGLNAGVVISEWDYALGIVTQSLVKNDAPEELGNLTVFLALGAAGRFVASCSATHTGAWPS